MFDDERPALFVDGINTNEDFDLDIPPATGQEYLRRVMQEARGCPRVVIADIDTQSYMHKQTLKLSAESGAVQAPAGLAPTADWQRQQSADFSDVRQKLSRWKASLKVQKVTKPAHLPPRNDVAAWCRLSIGRLKHITDKVNGISRSDDDDDISENATREDQEGQADPQNSSDRPEATETPIKHIRVRPVLSVVCFMDQPMIISVLEYHIKWLEDVGFSRDQGEWLYALLVCLEKPLDPEACSLLRHLARASSTLRATLDTNDHPYLTSLNLFICLVAHYFDQKDLADDR